MMNLIEAKYLGMAAGLLTLTLQCFNSLHATKNGISSPSGIGHLELRSDFISQSYFSSSHVRCFGVDVDGFVWFLI